MNQQQLNKIDEEFTSIIHDVWSKWQQYLNSKLRYSEFTGENGGTFAEYCLPADYYDRWSKQADMSFAELSETEKQSDRNIFEQYYKHFFHSKLQEAYELGRRDEAESNIEMIEEMKEEGRVGTGWCFDGMSMMKRFDELINKIKSLQTNKE